MARDSTRTTVSYAVSRQPLTYNELTLTSLEEEEDKAQAERERELRSPIKNSHEHPSPIKNSQRGNPRIKSPGGGHDQTLRTPDRARKVCWTPRSLHKAKSRHQRAWRHPPLDSRVEEDKRVMNVTAMSDGKETTTALTVIVIGSVPHLQLTSRVVPVCCMHITIALVC